MIKLNKGAEPKILADNKKDWTESLLDLIAGGHAIPHSLYTKYNQKEVKDALRKECSSKCMYCESSVEHISDLHIEHYRPKAQTKYPELTFEYDNLGLACPVCNRNKSDTFDEGTPFINPYVDDPSEYFSPCGALVFAKPGNARAKLSEKEIELNRAGLMEQRGERLKMIRSLIEEYAVETRVVLKNAIRKQILLEVAGDKIYSFCTSYFVRLTLSAIDGE